VDVQKLFERYNRKYFGGKLPPYTVEISNKYATSRCCKAKRTIYLNEKPEKMKVALLHEMAHTISRSGHGPGWRRQMARLQRLGAPIPKSEYQSYARRNKIDPCREYLEEIEGAAMDAPDLPIHELVQSFCYDKGFITIEGVAETASERRFLREALKVAKEARTLFEKKNHGA
jgi:hypothetical protein